MAQDVVALRKESVDRNNYVSLELPFDRWSLSARRAWIEILEYAHAIDADGSLSARRAWIEILAHSITPLSGCCRSPQGERG